MRYYVSSVMKVGVPNIVTNVRCSPVFTNLAKAGERACVLQKLNPSLEIWVCKASGEPILKAHQ